MTEKQAIILAIITAIIGLLLLYYTLPEQKNEREITITGKILSTEQKEKMTILKLDPKTPLTIISFQKTNAQKNTNVKITGRLQEYKGKIEFIANKITDTND